MYLILKIVTEKPYGEYLSFVIKVIKVIKNYIHPALSIQSYSSFTWPHIYWDFWKGRLEQIPSIWSQLLYILMHCEIVRFKIGHNSFPAVHSLKN